MKLVFLTIETGREDWLDEFRSIYLKKISRFLAADHLPIKSSSHSRANKDNKISVEALSILKVLKADDFVILCDERGEDVSTKTFTNKFIKCVESGKKRLVIIIGGAFGVDASIQEKCHWRPRLSALTFNHHVAQMVVMEQVYRALTIWKNVPYHNE